MLKETKKQTFLSHFYHWSHFNWGARLAPPMSERWALALCHTVNTALVQCRATEDQGAVPPLTVVCAPPFWFTQKTVFGTSRYDKITANDEKRE